MSKKPAERFGLSDRGEIAKGKRADFTIVDLNADDVVDSRTFESKGKNTPFNGWPVKAKVLETYAGGQSVWKG
jgi:dihydroorotase